MKKELSTYEMVKAIDEVKKYFEKQLEIHLSLIKVQSPLFVKSDSGLQDCLSGVEKSVSFLKGDEKFEIVHSLAKWKRDALGRYGFPMHMGLLTDMKAIRKDEVVDAIHSFYVEQWDWEKVIDKKDRSIDYLKQTVQELYQAILQTVRYVRKKGFVIPIKLPKDVFFITSQELEDLYPDCTPKEREERIVREKKVVFIIGIGDKLKSGIPHDLRSPDYDDWSLDGDLLFYDPAIDGEMEMTSMGIRVDEKSLVEQLEKSHCMDRIDLPYHQSIIKKQIPYSIGGGIGISRVLMFLFQKSHIAEIQASSWDSKTLDTLKDRIIL